MNNITASAFSDILHRAYHGAVEQSASSNKIAGVALLRAVSQNLPVNYHVGGMGYVYGEYKASYFEVVITNVVSEEELTGKIYVGPGDYREPTYEIKQTKPPVNKENPMHNTLHVTVTGFGENSGGEALAKHIHGWCHAYGFANTNISLADTTLPTSGRSSGLPNKDTVIHITGVESRGDTDSTQPDEASNEDLCAEEVMEHEDGKLDPASWGEETPVGACVCHSTLPAGKLTLNLEIPDHDVNPLTTINYFRDAYYAADINVCYKVNDLLIDYLSTAKVQEGEDDPELPPTPAEEEIHTPVGLQEIPPATRVLSDKNDLSNAYVLTMATTDGDSIAVMYLDTNSSEFNPVAIKESGVEFVHPDVIEDALTKHVPQALEYLEQLKENNARYLAEFDAPVVPKKADEPFTIFTLKQDQVPNALYNVVEDCWTDWQNPGKLPQLALEVGDASVVIATADYDKKVGYGSRVYMQHPRIEELFLKLLRARSAGNSALRDWLVKMGKA